MNRSSRKLTSPRLPLRVELLDDRNLPSFVTATSFPVGPTGGANSDPVGIVTGDFNRDGKTDVVTVNSSANGISLLLGNGKGGFGASLNTPLGTTATKPVAIHAVDFNGDGKLDLVTANDTTNNVTLLLGNGLGGFKNLGNVNVGTKPAAIASGDFNGDGKIDLATANNGTNTVTLLFGDGLGKFLTSSSVTVGSSPTSIVVADFNKDSHPDIATVSGGFGHLDINLNNGDGTFATKVNYDTGFVANTVVAGDFNGDSQPDLAVACNFPSSDGVSILLGNANGTFQTFQKYDVGGQTPAKIAVADLNGDGFKDLVTANSQFANNSVSILPGIGDGTFGPASVFTGGQSPEAIAVGDFNSDGQTDVVTADKGSTFTIGGRVGTVTLMLGNGDGTLVAAPDLTVSSPGPIIASDLTGDGKPDLAVVTGGVSYSGITIFPGIGNGNFGPRLLTTPISIPKSVASGEFNGDANKDLVIATSAGVTILPGTGGGAFGTRVDYAISGIPTWVAVDDFNGDNKPDLVVTTGNGASLLLGNGDGTFTAPVSLSVGGSSTYVTTGDFNKDTKRDLAVVNGSANTVSVLFGVGDGTFGTPKAYPTRTGPGSVSTGDFNRDGKTDLAIPTFFGVGGNSALAILQNGLAGNFTQKAEYATDSKPVGSISGDWNGDSKPDIAVANNFGDTVQVFNGTGLGTMAATPTRYVVGDRPTWIVSSDLNGDGKPDLAVVNSNSGTVTLLQTPTPATSFKVQMVQGVVDAGKPVTFKVFAIDALGHLIPNFTGGVTFTSTDPKATLPARYVFTAADKGIHTFTATLRTAGSQNIVVQLGGATGTGTTLVNALAATHFGLSFPKNSVAGATTDLTVAALDVFGNPDPNFAGTVHFAVNDLGSGVSIPADYTFTLTDEGSHTFTGGVSLRTAGLRTITATRVGKPTFKGIASTTVAAGAIHGFKLTGFPLIVTANIAKSFTVTAQDAFGNTITNYTGTVQFSVNGGTATLPAPTAFTLANKGRRVFSVKMLTPGTNEELVVTDTLDPLISGVQSGITVK